MFKGLASNFTLVVEYKYRIMGRKSQAIFFLADLPEREPAIIWMCTISAVFLGVVNTMFALYFWWIIDYQLHKRKKFSILMSNSFWRLGFAQVCVHICVGTDRAECLYLCVAVDVTSRQVMSAVYVPHCSRAQSIFSLQNAFFQAPDRLVSSLLSVLRTHMPYVSPQVSEYFVQSLRASEGSEPTGCWKHCMLIAEPGWNLSHPVLPDFIS